MKEYSALRNRIGYGIGTIGRDMVAAMVSLYLMFYVTDVLRVSTETLASLTVIMVFMRIFDGVNDPFMGTLVDSTQTRWGKFKPWIFGGALAWAIAHVLMFVDTGLSGLPYLLVFTLFYLAWELAYTANDIAYWSMIPSLSRDQKEREKIGSVARICASLGMFAFIVSLLPLTNFLAGITGSLQKGWLLLAVITAVLMLLFQFISLAVIKEERIPLKAADEKTGFLELFKIIFKNDQLLIVTCAMLFFMSGYTATTGLGIYYFKYIYGDENMYSVFALILGVSQILGLAFFPLVSKRMKRRSVFSLAIALVLTGYAAFYFSPPNMIYVGIAGIFIFVGQAFIQVLMLMFIADSVEYGQWKFGKRNESVTFSLQPLIYKVSNAIATGLIGFTVIRSGIKEAELPADVTARGGLVLKNSMLIYPAIFVVIAFIIIFFFYKIDEKFYAEILRDNKEAEAAILAERKD